MTEIPEGNKIEEPIEKPMEEPIEEEPKATPYREIGLPDWEKNILLRGAAVKKALNEKRKAIKDQKDIIEEADKELKVRKRNFEKKWHEVLTTTDFKAKKPPITNKEGREAYCSEKTESEQIKVDEQLTRLHVLKTELADLQEAYYDERLTVKLITAMYSSADTE